MSGGFWQHVWIARHALLGGLAHTIELSLIVIVIGTAIGAVGGVCLRYGALPLRFLVRAYVDILRGIPVLVLIFASFYGLALLGLDISAFLGGVVALSAFCGAHMSETIRGALASIPEGQTEAAKAIGLRPGSASGTWSCPRPRAASCRPGSTPRSRWSRARRCSR
jgi:polar amino acid transport system permease protein